MTRFIEKIARISAIAGGVVLTGLALMMTVSITGGAIAKLGYSDWLAGTWPSLAETIQNSGIRTIRGMYEIIKYGIAFVIFAFLPITSFHRAHAVVDVFTDFLPKRLNQGLILFWEVVFCAVLVIITWRLFHGMDRMMSRNVVSQELMIPEWWGYAVAVFQMGLASITSVFVVYAQGTLLITQKAILPQSDGAGH